MESSSPEGYQRSEWIYDWKHPSRSLLHSWTALVVVAAAFAVLLVVVRVSIDEPVERAAPGALRLHLGSDEIGRTLTQRARAKGPFPAKFDAANWEGFEPLRALLRQSIEVELTPHQPRLLAFPEPPASPPLLARRGEPVLPERPLDVTGPVADGNWRMVPVISVVDGITAGELPAALPDWKGEVAAELVSGQWRYLMELDDQGRVRQCVAMGGGGTVQSPQLATWLRSLVFRITPREEGRRWVAIAVAFENRSFDHGTDPE